MLVTCCQHAVHILIICRPYTGPMLTTCLPNAYNMPSTWWPHASNMVAPFWQHAGNMLATCWYHAGNNKAFFQGPETFIMETGGPFENCPPSLSLSRVSVSLSPYSVLLWAQLGAIRAQKWFDFGSVKDRGIFFPLGLFLMSQSP